MIKEFSSLAEKKQYEADRTNYYLRGISPSSTFEFYKNLFIETFTKEGRRLKKLYDGYEGGYYRDENGYIHTDYVGTLYLENFNQGDIIIVDDTEQIYVKNDSGAVLFYPFDDILNNVVSETNEAKWEISCDSYYPYCTNCYSEPKNGIMSNFCPNCGAKMLNPYDKNLSKINITP